MCPNSRKSKTQIDIVRLLRKKIIRLIQEFLEGGDNLNIQFDNAGGSLLTVALEAELYDIAKELIERGAHPNFDRNEAGNTPLMIALQKRQNDIAELLLEKGADPMIKNHFRQSAAHAVKARVMMKMVSWLI